MAASLAACLLLLIVARISGAQDAEALEILDRQEIAALVETVQKEGIGPGVRESVATQLRRDGFAEAEILRLSAAIEKRFLSELVRYVRTLQGRSFGSRSDADAEVAARKRLLTHNVSSWPKGYANGFPTTFTVDPGDADRLLIGVESLVRSNEAGLRETVRELAMSGKIPWEEVRILRDFSRERALRRARRTADRMKGASFFSEDDAKLFLETAIAGELDNVRAKVADPATRSVVIERARTRGAFSVN